METFDKTESVMKVIDSQIAQVISNGGQYKEVFDFLEGKKSKFDEIIQNLNPGETRYKFLVTHRAICEKRYDDFLFVFGLARSVSEFSDYSLDKVFKFIKLRDKLSKSKFTVKL